MGQKNITKNYIYNLIYQILVIILPIITIPYLSRTLGVEGIGIYGYTVSIVTYFSLLGALGLTNYGQREIAYVQDDKFKRSKVFCELVVFRFITVTAVTILFVLLFCINTEYKIYYIILTLELVATALDISWFFQGIEDFKKILIRNLIIKLISIVLIFMVIKTASDLWKYFVIYAGSVLLGNASLWFKITKYVDFVKVNFKDILKHVKPTITLFIPQIAVSVYTILDKSMLGMISQNMAEVGYYEQSQKIIKITLTFVLTIVTVMMPRIASNYAQGNNEQIRKYMEKTFNFVWFLAIPLMFGMIAISSEFVPWFLGEDYSKVSTLLVISSVIILIIPFSSVIGSQYLIATNRQNIHTKIVICGAIINVILNLILIKYYQSIGAVISTIIAELLISIMEITYVVKNKFINLKIIFKHSIKYILAGLIMLICILIIKKFMVISIISTLIQVGIGCIIYLGILLLIKDKFIYDIIKKLLSKFIKK